MDPITGAVKAWIGGIDFKTYKFDHVNINTKRQVGSSIKPFLYSLAIEESGFTPQTLVENTAQYFPGSGMVPAGGKCKGNGDTVTMATALAYSLNCASAYIIKQVGPQRFADFIKQINIPTKVEPFPSIALGSCDLSLYEMLWGYTMFPSSGFSSKPYYFSRIEDKNGNVLERFDTERKEVISQATAYTMCRMMQGATDVPGATAAGLRARLNIAEMGAKTGTTNDNSDASSDTPHSCSLVYGLDAMIGLSVWKTVLGWVAMQHCRFGNTFLQRPSLTKPLDWTGRQNLYSLKT
jgi:penicillin-binding protein 1A